MLKLDEKLNVDMEIYRLMQESHDFEELDVELNQKDLDEVCDYFGLTKPDLSKPQTAQQLERDMFKLFREFEKNNITQNYHKKGGK